MNQVDKKELADRRNIRNVKLQSEDWSSPIDGEKRLRQALAESFKC